MQKSFEYYRFIGCHSFEWWMACLLGIYPLVTIVAIGLLIIRVWLDTGIFPPRTVADMTIEYIRSNSLGASLPDFSEYEKTSTFYYPIHGWIAQNLMMGVILLILPCIAFMIMRCRRIPQSAMIFASVSWIGSLAIIWLSRDVWASWLFD